jgi:hypothetical protein
VGAPVARVPAARGDRQAACPEALCVTPVIESTTNGGVAVLAMRHGKATMS